MPNRNTKSIPKNINQYDAGDMHDLASLAENDMNWAGFAIQDTQKRVREVKKRLTEKFADAQYYFYELEKALEMYEYLIDDRHNSHSKDAERYEKEWAQLKGDAQ